MPDGDVSDSDAPDYHVRVSSPAGNAATQADVLIDRIKRGRKRFGQFRLASLMLATTLVAVVLSIPRLIGETYSDFFSGLFALAFALAFAFAPLLALFAAWLPPRMRTRNRWWIAVSVFATIIGIAVGIAAYHGELSALPEIIVGMVGCWTPAALCIAIVWLFIFREPERRRSLTTDVVAEPPASNDDGESDDRRRSVN